MTIPCDAAVTPSAHTPQSCGSPRRRCGHQRAQQDQAVGGAEQRVAGPFGVRHEADHVARLVGDAGDGNWSANRRPNSFDTAHWSAAGRGHDSDNTNFAAGCYSAVSTPLNNIASNDNCTPGSNRRSAARSGDIGTEAREALLVLRAEPDNRHLVSHDLRHGMLHGEW